MMRPAASVGKASATLAAGLLCAVVATAPVRAASIDVPAGRRQLAAAVAAARPGDALRLAAGVHEGPIVIDKPLTLQGVAGAVVDGRGVGRTIEVNAPDVTIRGLVIRGSGTALDRMDAAVFLSAAATRARVEGNDIRDNLVGVYIHGAPDAVARGNRIEGRRLAHLNDSGNGVYVWNAPGAEVLDNDISGGRDGIFTNASRDNRFVGNRIHDVRFAVHYMYTNNSEVSDNVSFGNHAGFVIMYSRNMKIANNISDGDRDNGLLLNYANESTISGNTVVGADKCVFIYNSNVNEFQRNLFSNCRVGIHFTAGSERNRISENAFIGNRNQVMYVGTRFLDWSVNGRGNYWSDNPAFDLDGDGRADAAFRPNDIMDQVVWRAPAAKLLMNSPAAQIVRWAQSQFPALHPGGVVDSTPLMTPPVPTRLRRTVRS